MNANPSPKNVYRDFDVVYQNNASYQNQENLKIPYIVAKSILKEGDVKDGMSLYHTSECRIEESTEYGRALAKF